MAARVRSSRWQCRERLCLYDEHPARDPRRAQPTTVWGSYWIGETARAVISRSSVISQQPSNPVSRSPAIIGPATSRRAEKEPSVWPIVGGQW
jgi:hypothetical protein